MADLVLAQPVKQSFWLVLLKWGDPSTPHFWRLTDANEDLVIAGSGLYEATPILAVKSVANTGVFERKTWEFDIPTIGVSANNLALLDALSSGRASSPVFLKAWEYSIEGGEVQVLYLLEGTIAEVVRNPNGRSELARFRVTTLKAEMQRAIGIQADDNCVWTFGNIKTCGLNISNLKEGGSLTVIDGLSATITGLSVQRDRYWNRGFIERDGVRIKIKEWISGTSFLLTRFIPLDWEQNLPVTVSVTPGCDKKISTCSLWGQLLERLAPGEKIPEYNPTMGES